MTDNNENKVLNVPHLRFPEFSGEWEIYPLTDFMSFKNGMNPDAKRFGRGTKFISVMDILNNQFICYDNIRASVEVVDGDIETYGVNYGDILFQRSSETLEDVGQANVYLDSKPAVFGGFVIRGKSKSNYYPMFFRYLLASPTARKKIIVKGAGAQHFNIGQDGLSKVCLNIPSIQEQEKIAKLFECIDTRIATQNKIIEDLKKLKSAISLKMLHSDSWEQFKIQDIASIGRGRVMGYLDDFMFEGEYISWTTDGANAGTVFYRNGKFNCTNVCGLLKLKKGFDAHFVSLVLAEATRMYVSTNLANPKLMNNTMGNIQIRLPKLEEQKRISVVFRKLHGLLETHNSLIIKYSKQKQYLLSQMFI